MNQDLTRRVLYLYLRYKDNVSFLSNQIFFNHYSLKYFTIPLRDPVNGWGKNRTYEAEHPSGDTRGIYDKTREGRKKVSGGMSEFSWYRVILNFPTISRRFTHFRMCTEYTG